MRFTIIAIFLFSVLNLSAQQKESILDPADSFNLGRVMIISGIEVSSYAGMMVGLNELWYKDYPRSKFHFFNDNPGWNQVDKVGHFHTSYLFAEVGSDMLDWAGVKHSKSRWYGGLLGTYFLTTIEILDGFSAEWGASAGDLLMNSGGSLMWIAQDMAWGEQKFRTKFGFSPSKYNPVVRARSEALFGKNYAQRFLKDYNAQDIWLSFNIKSIVPSINVPKWLNIAVGYGSTGMLGAESNQVFEDGVLVADYSFVERKRQFFLSPDIDFRQLGIKKKGWRSFLNLVNFLKMPAPVIFLEGGKLKAKVLHW